MKEIKVEYLTCPIRQVVSKFCDKWSLLVLYTLHASKGGVMRFTELHHHMTDCSQKMLSSTLKNLEKHNLISRKVYPVVQGEDFVVKEHGGDKAFAVLLLLLFNQ